MRSRALTDTDRAAWASYARLVAPMPGVVVPPPEPLLLSVASQSVEAPQPAPPRLPPKAAAALHVGAAPGGLDAATWNRFRQGKLVPARTLDLHGRTAQHAYQALDAFLHGAAASSIRCVEVITGRGKGEAGGVIRREFPLWLNQPHLRGLILAATHPHALNLGSVRLLLKRARPPAQPGR